MNFRSRSQTPNSSDRQRVDVNNRPSKDMPGKIKGFLYSLVVKRIKKLKKPKREEGYQTPLEELDVKKLIRLYCKYENLYNPKHYYYGNREFAEDCYNDIARSIPGRSGSELRSCIEELRDLFEREYKVIESTRLAKGKAPLPSILYYNEFLFLVPYLSMDFNEPHAESGTSSQKQKYVIKPAPELPSNKLNNFTGFPLAAFPGNICCSPKEILKRTFKKDGKKQTKETKQIYDTEKELQDVNLTPSAEQRLNDILAGKRDSKVSITSSHYGDEQSLKITDLTCPLRLGNSPCVSECRLSHLECRHSECQVSDSKSPSKPQESIKPADEAIHPMVLHTCVKSNRKHHSAKNDKCARRSVNDSVPIIPLKPKETFKSIVESFTEEQETFMMAHPPNSVGKEKSTKSSSQAKPQISAVSGPDNKPGASSLTEERKEAAPEDKRDNPSVAKYQNFKQVQMLCDMIRTELTAAPDFIYFDAKWRIIEILREVHKRQLVHMKARPHKKAINQQLDPVKTQLDQVKTQLPIKLSKNSPPPPTKPVISKICDHIRGSHCPYCCHH